MRRPAGVLIIDAKGMGMCSSIFYMRMALRKEESQSDGDFTLPKSKMYAYQNDCINDNPRTGCSGDEVQGQQSSEKWCFEINADTPRGSFVDATFFR